MNDTCPTEPGVEVVIARTGHDAYRVVFRGQRSEGVTRQELAKLFPDLPPITIGDELTANWVMTDV